MRQWVKQQHDVERDLRVKESTHARKKEMKDPGDGREKTGYGRERKRI